MGDETDSRILNAARTERRVDFLTFKNTILRRGVYVIFFALGSIFLAGGGWYVMEHRVEAVELEVEKLPTAEVLIQKEETHKQVHVTQENEFQHIKKSVDSIEKQQKVMAQQVTNMENNVWKIAQKLGIE